MAEILPTLFFLNGKLHKRLKIVRIADTVVAFCYPEEERVQYFYSSTLRSYQKAYTLKQVSALIKRPYVEIQKFLKNKLIEKPSGLEYQIATRRPTRLLWSEDDVFELRDRIYELFPRGKDGFPHHAVKLATRAELKQAMRGSTSYFVRNSDGEEVQVWRAL